MEQHCGHWSASGHPMVITLESLRIKKKEIPYIKIFLFARQKEKYMGQVIGNSMILGFNIKHQMSVQRFYSSSEEP